VQRRQLLLGAAGALRVARPEPVHDFSREPGREIGNGEDPADRAELERGVEQRAVADEQAAASLTHVRVLGEALDVTGRVLQADDVRVPWQLTDESGGERDLR